MVERASCTRRSDDLEGARGLGRGVADDHVQLPHDDGLAMREALRPTQLRCIVGSAESHCEFTVKHTRLPLEFAGHSNS